MLSRPLSEVLESYAREGELYERLPGERIRCFACGHRCPIPEGHAGVCKVRFNRGGKLFVPSDYVGALQDDPIEKKPFFHALPGARALSFGMLGCDYHCSYCQNWITSQALRDPAAVSPPVKINAESLIEIALGRQCRVVTSTYNEPLITSEWAVEIFRLAKQAGLMTSYVSNGNATPEVLDYIRPFTDLYKIDLKGFDDRRYRELGGVLENVCESIRGVYQRGFWLEIVTLLIPGFNDSEDEIKKLTGFIASVSIDVPWHVTAYHQDYRMQDHYNTTAEQLLRAADIGKRAGLRYVYPGNLPGNVGRGECTWCPGCGTLLVERTGFRVFRDLLSSNGGRCPDCSLQIPGVWDFAAGKKSPAAGS